MQSNNTTIRRKPVTNPISKAVRWPLVVVRYAGYKIGLYRVKRVEPRAMVLGHGGISFPEGTRIEVEDFQHLVPFNPDMALNAVVVENDAKGIVVSW